MLVLFIPISINASEFECESGIQLSTGDCFFAKYPPIEKFPYDKSKGLNYYLERYYNESEYKNWFEKNYPDLTIEEVIGLVEPYSRIVEKFNECDATAREKYDQALRNYASSGGSLIGAEINIGKSLNDFWLDCVEQSGIISLNDVGFILADKEQHREALKYYDKVLDLYPEYTVALMNKATSLFYLKEFDLAISYYDKVEEIDPLYAKEYENLKKISQEMLSEKQTSMICGEGTVLKDGKCVVDPNYPNPPTQGGCLIATAAYGSELAPQVQLLREIRDNKVLSTESGSSFMESFNTFYYSFSPTIADYERQNPVFKEAVKITITPLISSLSILNFVEMDSESDVLLYGISLILLNIGMYFASPAIIILKSRKKI